MLKYHAFHNGVHSFWYFTLCLTVSPVLMQVVKCAYQETYDELFTQLARFVILTAIRARGTARFGHYCNDIGSSSKHVGKCFNGGDT